MSASFDRRGAVALWLLDRFPVASLTPLGRSVPARALWFFVDARRDPFFPASVLGACWFVARHWWWLSSPSGPYGEPQ